MLVCYRYLVEHIHLLFSVHTKLCLSVGTNWNQRRVGVHYLENMSFRAVQCLGSSWLFSCRAARRITGKQSLGSGYRELEGLRAFSISARLCVDDKVTHTGQVRC